MNTIACGYFDQQRSGHAVLPLLADRMAELPELGRLCAGEEAAWAKMLPLIENTVRVTLLAHCRKNGLFVSPQQIEDIASDALKQVWNDRKKFTSHLHLFNFVRKFSKDRFVDYLRLKENRVTERLSETHYSGKAAAATNTDLKSPDTIVEEMEREEIADAKLACLNSTDRTFYWDRFICGSLDQLAKKHGIAKSTAAGRIKRIQADLDKFKNV